MISAPWSTWSAASRPGRGCTRPTRTAGKSCCASTCAQASCSPLIERGGGAYVGVSARPALRPFPGAAAYVTSKAAVLAFVQALDADYRADGIRANAILPSVIDTPANRAAEPDADYSKWVQPAEIAKVVRFLVSDDAAVTSGAAIPVYGRA
jgi:NAD(P)-dependent dehydrogenase (short-subunit alcohol dehydrogenase family)